MIIKIDTPLESIFRLSPFQKKALAKMQLKKMEDILRHFPSRYGEASAIKAVEFLRPGESAVVFGKIYKLKTAKTFKSRLAISTAEVEDGTGKIKIVWFNQPYIAKMFFEGALVRVEGKVSLSRKTPQSGVTGLHFSNPKIEKVNQMPEGVSGSLFSGEDSHNLSPIY